MNNQNPIIIDADAEDVVSTRFSKIKFHFRLHAIEYTTAAVITAAGALSAAYLIKEVKNRETMDEATELRLIAEGKI